MARSPEGWPTKAKQAPSPHEVRLAPLDTDPVFQCPGDKLIERTSSMLKERKTVHKDEEGD